MNTRLYWTIQHMKRGAHDVRFAATCWWLSQRVDFLAWRWRLEALMPRRRPILAPAPGQQGDRYAMSSV